MTQTVQLGPLVLSLPLLMGIAAFLIAGWTGRRLGKDQAAEVDRQLLRTVLVGLVVARLAFVVQFRDAYLKSPLGILDIRDGGWHAAIGVGAALAYAGVVLVRRAAQTAGGRGGRGRRGVARGRARTVGEYTRRCPHASACPARHRWDHGCALQLRRAPHGRQSLSDMVSALPA